MLNGKLFTKKGLWNISTIITLLILSMGCKQEAKQAAREVLEPIFRGGTISSSGDVQEAITAATYVRDRVTCIKNQGRLTSAVFFKAEGGSQTYNNFHAQGGMPQIPVGTQIYNLPPQQFISSQTNIFGPYNFGNAPGPIIGKPFYGVTSLGDFLAFFVHGNGSTITGYTAVLSLCVDLPIIPQNRPITSFRFVQLMVGNSGTCAIEPIDYSKTYISFGQHGPYPATTGILHIFTPLNPSNPGYCPIPPGAI